MNCGNEKLTVVVVIASPSQGRCGLRGPPEELGRQDGLRGPYLKRGPWDECPGTDIYRRVKVCWDRTSFFGFGWAPFGVPERGFTMLLPASSWLASGSRLRVGSSRAGSGFQFGTGCGFRFRSSWAGSGLWFVSSRAGSGFRFGSSWPGPGFGLGVHGRVWVSVWEFVGRGIDMEEYRGIEGVCFYFGVSGVRIGGLYKPSKQLAARMGLSSILNIVP